MAHREERIRLFEETMQLCIQNKRLSQFVSESIHGQKLYWQADKLPLVEKKPYTGTPLLLSTYRTMEAARRYVNLGKRVCVLNFASSVNPGGGVTRGASAQEESICRISTLYPAINDKSVREFYDSHRKRAETDITCRMNSDDCIFTPGVFVIREDTHSCSLMEERDWFRLDVITCAAPDLRRSYVYRPTDDELYALHYKRFQRILTIAALHNAEVLILGAFGCGAFYNPPELVSKAAGLACEEFQGCFETIEFAIPSGNPPSDNYLAFSGIPGIQAAE